MNFYKAVYLFFCFIFIGFSVSSQCLTDYQQIGPEERFTSNYSTLFGNSFDVHGNYAVIGASNSDSLENNAGLAFIYHFDGVEWQKIGTLSSSVPTPNEEFGKYVQIIQDVIIVTVVTKTYSIPKVVGKIYIFEKPSTGWQSMSETAVISSGSNVTYAEINKENSSIAVLNLDQIEIYYKSSASWVGTPSTPNYTIDFDADLKFADFSIDGNILAVGLKGNHNIDSRILLYKSELGDWSDTKLIQSIIKKNPYYFGHDIKLYNDQLITHPADYNSDTVYLFTTSDSWTSINPEIYLTSAYGLGNAGSAFFSDPSIDMNDSIIIVSRSKNGFNKPQISVYKKPSGGWKHAVEDHHYSLTEHLDNYEASPISFYGDHLFTKNLRGREMFIYKRDVDVMTLTNELKYIEKNTTGVRYGYKVAVHPDEEVMAVSSYNDKETIGGLVSLYTKNQNNEWEYLFKIAPPEADSLYLNFGFEILFYKNYLLISAVTYREPDMPRHTGAVYVYKKNGPTWLNPLQIALLRPSNWMEAADESNGLWLNFGYSLAMEKNTIAIGAPGKDKPGVNFPQDHGQIYIFEKEDTTEWTSGYENAILTATSTSGNSAIGKSISLENNIIATLENWSDVPNKGRVILFERPEKGWVDTTEIHNIMLDLQQPQYLIYSGLINGKVILENNRLFVGHPYYSGSGVRSSGAIYLLKKFYSSWSETVTINTITSLSPRENQWLGREFDVEGNTLISGTSYLYGRYYYSKEYETGFATVIQGITHDWSEYVEMIKLHGTKSMPVDGFGHSVGFSKDNFIVGAHHDNSETGYSSGAVYAIATPPIIYLEDPICYGTDPFLLNAYPGNGTWSGNGIVDSNTGLFDPSLAGIGTHELTYSTPNCAYDGRLKITVSEPPNTSFSTAPDIKLCKNDTAVVDLTISNHTYFEWYYISPDSKQPKLIQKNIEQIKIFNEGKYFVRSYSNLCQNVSDTLNVRKLITEIKVDSLPIICNKNKSVSLNVTPLSGMWNTSIIENNILNPSTLENDTYEFVYTVNMENSCNYSDTLNLVIDHLPYPEVKIEDNNPCEDGVILVADNVINAQYYWSNHADNSWNPAPGNNNNSQYNAEENGKYNVTLTKHSCSLTSEDVEVDFIPANSVITIKPVPIICDKEKPINLDVTPQSGSWNSTIFKNNKLNASALNNGTYNFIYSVPYEDVCHFRDTIEITIDHLEAPEIIVNDPDPCIAGAEYVVKNKDIDATYIWEVYKNNFWETSQESSTEAKYSAVEQGQYRLTVSKHSCSKQSDIYQVQNLPPDSLFAPNVITANNDGKNEFFTIYKENLKQIDLKIYNRWGIEVYSSEDYQNQWPDNNIEAGVYFYILHSESNCKSREATIVKGNITVFK